MKTDDITTSYPGHDSGKGPSEVSDGSEWQHLPLSTRATSQFDRRTGLATVCC